MKKISRPTRRDLLQIGAVVAVGYGVSIVLRQTVPLGRDVSDDGVAQALLRDRDAPAEGPEDADVVMVVFTDYQCPACRQAAPEMAAAVRGDGNVRLVYKDYPILGHRSGEAARTALAAHRQGLYVPVHHALMAETRPLEPDVLREVIEAAGGKWALIERDLGEHRAAIDALLLANQRQAHSLGITGTPTFLIGSRLVMGMLSQADLQRGFDAARS